MKFLAKLEKWVGNSTVVDIVCHTDSDGLTAASQLINYLKTKNIGYNIVLGSPERLRHPSFWRLLKNDLVFFLDIPADHERDELSKLSQRANIIIIDHHNIMHDMNSDSIIHYHRELLNEERYYPASKMVYDILGGIDWMACIGLIGDYAGKPWKEFINSIHDKYGYTHCKDENCFDSPFSDYDRLINSARMAQGDKGCLKALNILVKSADWLEFKENAMILENWAKQVNDYIEFVKSDYDINKVQHKGAELIFYELVNPKYRIGSVLSTIVSTETPNRAVIIIIHKDNAININIRRQDGEYDMSELAKLCTNDIEGSGGGHRKASGATIKEKDLDSFKDCVINTLSQWVKEHNSKSH